MDSCGRTSQRVTRTDARDASIVQAFRDLLGVGFPTKSKVLPVLGRIFEFLAAEIDTIRGGMDGDVIFDREGMRNYEDIHEFLLRIREEAIRDVPAGHRPYLRLLTILPADTWYVFLISYHTFDLYMGIYTYTCLCICICSSIYMCVRERITLRKDANHSLSGSIWFTELLRATRIGKMRFQMS